MQLLKIFGRYACAALILLAGAAAAAVWYLDRQGVAPAALARYAAPGGGQDNALLRGRQWAGAALLRLDRRANMAFDPAGLTIGAQLATPGPEGGRTVPVASTAALRAAIDQASPGDVIVLAPGVYRVAGTNIEVRRPGSAATSITLRGAGAVIEFDTSEGFVVSAPYWRFEQLALRGVCARDADCEHAFHVVGNAHHFAARNNTISGFNAHFKINGSAGRFPDHGIIDGNTLTNGAPRHTANPVTPIDLVAASDWTIRRNLIADFVKAGGDQISYGAFAKGGGARNRFEQNIVWCERLLRNEPGARVGLSLGGGGTAPRFCRDGKCIVEQEDSVIAANLVAACSDDGVYVNSAARSSVVHNTLIGTAGMALRFPATSADVEGNLVDGPIRNRDGAIGRLTDNLASPLAYRYLGYDPHGGWLAAGPGQRLAWLAAAPRRRAVAVIPPDLCGAVRPATPAYGAFEDFSACRTGSAGN